MVQPLRVLVAGLGSMGRVHARAYHDSGNYEIAGLVTRGNSSIPHGLQDYRHWTDFEEALAATRPDLVSINTYTDTHADYAVKAMRAGAHIFVEKPLALTIEDARSVVDEATQLGRKLLVGYILRHHPLWQRLIAEARALGGPYVFRINLNQQSEGAAWETHKKLMHTSSPILDCGVHYVDAMCQVTDARAIEVRGMGVRLSPQIGPAMYNYGHLQVLFADGSAGWFESGWGPMVSDTARFIKDVMSEKGSVSIVSDPETGTDCIRIHRADLDGHGNFLHEDETLRLGEATGREALCIAQQAYLHKAIAEDIDLSRHMQDSIESLRICLAADQSIRTGKPVAL